MDVVFRKTLDAHVTFPKQAQLDVSWEFPRSPSGLLFLRTPIFKKLLCLVS